MGVRTGEMARLLGVTPQTVRKYVAEEKVPYHRTPGGQIFFTDNDIAAALGEHPTTEVSKKWAFYTRSSSGNKSLLESQYKSLRDIYGTPDFHFKDSASGLNENRKGLRRLLEKIEDGHVTDVAVCSQDCLSRFGVTYLERMFALQGVNIHYLNDKRSASAEEELMSDFMSLIASFSGRFYRMRSTENQKALLDNAREKLGE